MKKHDENCDLQSIGKIAKIDYGSKTIRASKNAVIGIKRLGKIDFLVHYCGWHFVWDNSVPIANFNSEPQTSARDVKKLKKEHKLTDKTKK